MNKKDPKVKISTDILKEIILKYVEKMDDLEDRKQEIIQEELEICISEMKLFNDLKNAILRNTDTHENGVREQCNTGTLGLEAREALEAENGHC